MELENSIKKRVLFISDKNFITRSNQGGTQCAFRNYQLCTKTFGKENVFVLIISDEKGIDECLIEKGICGKVIWLQYGNLGKYYHMIFLRHGYSQKQLSEMKDYIKLVNPHIVFFDGTGFGGLVRIFDREVKILAFYHNIEKHYAQTRLLKSCFVWLIKFFSFYHNEKIISKRADYRICLNHRDSELLYKTYRVKADYLLPITFEDIGEEKLNANEAREGYLLFVGSYFMPNVEGIKWFCKNVMPYLSRKLVIVGKDMERLKKQLTASNIEVVGTVDDLSWYYNNAAAVVMPIFVGDGMKVKTAQAMMYGKPIFATDEALEGYEVEGISGIYRCNSREEFLAALKQDFQTGYVKDIRNMFLDKYNTEAIEDQAENFLSGLK